VKHTFAPLLARAIRCVAPWAAVGLLLACGSGSEPDATMQPVSVSVTPSTATVGINATQAFAATVSNGGSAAVSWQVNGIAGGNVSVGTISAAGVYTAPAAVPSPATVTVSAVSQADTTKSATASVTVSATPPIAVVVAPSSATVLTSATQTFTAAVNNTTNTAITWQVNGINGGNATVGTIAPNGLYTAPASVPTPASVTVKAVSVADTSKSGNASVTVSARPAITVSVSPPTASVAITATQTFTATVANSSNSAVSWQVNGIAGGNASLGTISASGIYVAPAAVPSPATVSVVAVSVADGTKTGSATVTVTGAAGGVSVAVNPSRAAITIGQTQQFSASVGGTTDTVVNWSVDGISGGSATVGTINSGGLYTPPTTGGSHTVTAVSHAAPAQSASAAVAVTDLAGIATQRYDAARTGQNLKEYALTPATLSTPGAFGKLFSCPVDGVLYAQPLFVANLAIGGGVHNVVFVATMHDSVYAFDADSPVCTTYWKTSFLSSGVTTVPASDTAETGDIPLEFGITGTPVIDLAAGALYAVANTRESGPTYFYRLHKLSLANGAEMANSPVLLANNTVYVAFGSHGDTSVYYGWVFGYDKTSLAPTGSVFNTAPHPSLSSHGGQAAIWMAGAGPAADASGGIFFSTGNGTFTASTGTVPPPADGNDFGDSVIKLSSALALTDYFTPTNESSLNAADADLGAGGVMVLPDSVGSTAHHHLAIIGDKESKLFLIDRDAMGRYSSSGPDANVQTLLVNSSGSGVFTGIFSTPTVWGTTLYIGATNDKVKAYTIGNAQIALTPSSTSSDTYAFPGTNTVVSSGGTSGGVLWAIDTNKNGTAGRATGPFILRAYDATNLATRLWSSDASSADTGGNAAKFSVPTVANGKVYVGGLDKLTVYGLRP